MKRCLMARGTRYAKHTAAFSQIVNALSEDKNAKYSAQSNPHSSSFLCFLWFPFGLLFGGDSGQKDGSHIKF